MENINFESMQRKRSFKTIEYRSPIWKIRGKYNKALYFMLKYSRYKNKYSCDYKDFKYYLGIPKSYRASHINTKILKYATIELKKFGIEIEKINKTKKSGKIEKIEIIFKEI